MWAIGNYQNIDEVKKIMLKNIASELSN